MNLASRFNGWDEYRQGARRVATRDTTSHFAGPIHASLRDANFCTAIPAIKMAG